MAFFMKLLIFIVLPFTLLYIVFITFSKMSEKKRERERQHELEIEREKTRQSENISKHLE